MIRSQKRKKQKNKKINLVQPALTRGETGEFGSYTRSLGKSVHLSADFWHR